MNTNLSPSPYRESAGAIANKTPTRQMAANALNDEEQPTERLNRDNGKPPMSDLALGDKEGAFPHESRNSMPEAGMRHQLKATQGSIKSALTTSTKKRKAEHHRKTMLKVMDPNVHQMTLSRNHAAHSDDDDDFYEVQQSARTGQTKTVIVKGGLEPKIEMKRKIARQSDLILSLEKSEIRKSSEVENLRRTINDQEVIINELR